MTYFHDEKITDIFMRLAIADVSNPTLKRCKLEYSIRKHKAIHNRESLPCAFVRLFVIWNDEEQIQPHVLYGAAKSLKNQIARNAERFNFGNDIQVEPIFKEDKISRRPNTTQRVMVYNIFFKKGAYDIST